MIENVKGKPGAPVLAALFLVNFAYMADMAVVPAADGIFTEFADASMGVLNFILTGPQLLGMLAAIASGPLMRRFSKRSLLLAMMALFCVVSCAGALVRNVWYVAAMRGVVGLAIGGTSAVALSFIRELWGDDEEKTTGYISYFSAATAAVGAVMAIVAGILCVGDWTHAFWEYLAGIPILVLMWLVLPKTQPEGGAVIAAGPAEASSSQGIITPSLAAFLVSLLVVGITFNFTSYQGALYVAETGIGDSVLAGIFSSVITVATCISCMVFEPVYARIGRMVAPVMYALLAMGFLGLFLLPGAITTGICMFVIGWAYGIAMSYFFVYVAELVDDSQVSTVTGWVSACVGLGAFLCSYASTAVMGILGTGSLLPVCLSYAVVLGAGTVLSAALALRARRT